MNRKKVAELMREMPELASVLYDLDLMPEQITDAEKWKMYSIAAHFEKMKQRLLWPVGNVVKAGIGEDARRPDK